MIIMTYWKKCIAMQLTEWIRHMKDEINGKQTKTAKWCLVTLDKPLRLTD